VFTRSLTSEPGRSADKPHSRIIRVLREKFISEPKKREIRNAIVFKNNRCVMCSKHGSEAARYPPFEAEVHLSKIFRHGAWPIHPPDDFFYLFNSIYVERISYPRTVNDENELPRFPLSDPLKNSRGHIWSIESKENHGKLGDIAHSITPHPLFQRSYSRTDAFSL
jgi:hypothetical protein